MAVAERETRAFSVSIDGAVRQAQKRVDERVDAAIAARVDPAIMSALEKAPKTTALVDELTLKLEARITEQAAPIVARLAREEVVRHQLASAIEQRVARTAQQRTIEVLVGVAGGLLAGGAIASHFNNRAARGNGGSCFGRRRRLPIFYTHGLYLLYLRLAVDAGGALRDRPAGRRRAAGAHADFFLCLYSASAARLRQLEKSDIAMQT